ncbi:MAG: hypothetical protein WD096_02615 [Actinomycetota bacterium]
MPLSRYAREQHTTLRTIRKYFAGGVARDERGRVVASAADRAPRVRLFAFEGRVDFLTIRGSRATARADEIWRTQQRFALDPSRENEAKLREFAGERVAGREVEADPDTILDLVQEAEPEEIAERYRELFG